MQTPLTWAATKLLAFVLPVEKGPRPRSTLDEVEPAETIDRHDWRNRDEARRMLRGWNAPHHPFEPRYLPLLHRPHNSQEAQLLYNHIRTVAWYLDSIPLLGSSLPFNIGIDSIVGIVPWVGDYIGLILGLYQIVLCSLFGLPWSALFWMLFNVVVDCMVGLVPIIGDALDVVFKANLRNLRLLEDHLYHSGGKCGAGVFYIEFAPSDRFMPPESPSSSPPPTSALRSPAAYIESSDVKRRPTKEPRAYFLSLPSSIADSPKPNAGAGPPSEDVSGRGTVTASQEVTKEARQQTSQTTTRQLVEVEAYSIPEEASNATQPSHSRDSGAAQIRPPSLQPSEREHSPQMPTASPHSPNHVAAKPSLSSTSNASEALQALTPDASTLQIDEERPRVSWHDTTRMSPSTLVRPDAKRLRRIPSDIEDDIDDGFEDQRLLKSMSAERDRELEDPRALWRRRRGLYLLVYSAIFCVAYVTSLDSNTGYLYLNFACSEYGALASFSTVAIVQQMVFAIAKPPIAKLSDVVGRPQAYMLSLVFYVCGYIVVASTSSLRSLIGGICLQSAGTTGIQVLQSIIIADTTTAKWRGLVIGIVNLPFLINFAVAGPMVDLVMRHGGWRFGFAIWTVVVPIAATPLLLTLLVGQRRARRAGLATRSSLTDKPWRQALRQLARELDLLGLLLFTGGWLLILLPLTLAGHGERQAEVPMATFVLGGVGLLVVFGWWETRASVPILPYQFLTNSAVVCTCVVGVLDFASFSISWTFLSSFVQILKGWDQTKTGYFATTQNVTSTITGIVVGSLMAMTRRYKVLLMMGLVVRLVGVTLMVRYRTADDPTFMLVLCQLLQGIGGGSIAITMQVAVQVTVRHADVAIVTALELLTTEIGAAIGSATAGWMFQTYLPTKLAAHLPDMDADELKLVYGSLQKALSYPIGSAERSGIIQSWVEVMRMLSIVAMITLVPAVLLGLAIPDTSLPDVHGAPSHSHSHSHGHNHHNGSRRGDRRGSRRRPSFLSSSRPASPLEIRAGHSDITLGMGLVVGDTEASANASLLGTRRSKRDRSGSRNRLSEREARDESSLGRKKRRARRAVVR
ncbi:related to siderophore iron transporter mirc [Sporisorium reilianum f. sp. reilianum]|uniref:Related to siderophore iron transporter mirc n=1 Tax=Sporisorium reilianum f. sp. reilianum TaxID=72559 RepID=A0A2N8UCE1_9BASI|nr:related to siderophore iron transporter mirc [Sporisorium reilianum f. sp. reilianum]